LVVEKRFGSGAILPDDVVCFRAHTGLHLDVQDQAVRARFDDCGDWQAMLIQKEELGAIFSGDSIHLAAHTGKLLEVEGSIVQARWDEPGWWQTFQMFNYGGRSIFSGDVIFLQAHTGNMLDIEGVNVQARWQAWGEWQKLIVIRRDGDGPVMPGDSVFFQTHTDKMIEVDGVHVQARWNDRGSWQSLVVVPTMQRRLKASTVDASNHDGLVAKALVVVAACALAFAAALSVAMLTGKPFSKVQPAFELDDVSMDCVNHGIC